ncbi:hypothetical protein GCM10027345_04170 [Hymenobacter daeguensis]
MRELNGNSISYQKLLQTTEWDERRKQILDRDKHICQKCGKWETYKQYWGDVDYRETKQLHVWGDTNSIWFDGFDFGVKPNYKPPAIFGDKPIYTFNNCMAEIIADKPYHLEVHHRYYLLSSLPWQYRDEGLVTLCNWCHRELHANGVLIPVYPNQTTRDTVLSNNRNVAQPFSYYTPCSRCDGTGELPVYNHVQQGICFRCNGAGFDELRDFRIR